MNKIADVVADVVAHEIADVVADVVAHEIADLITDLVHDIWAKSVVSLLIGLNQGNEPLHLVGFGRTRLSLKHGL